MVKEPERSSLEIPRTASEEAWMQKVLAAFSPEGRLCRIQGFQFRPSQKEMAGFVAQGLAEGVPLLVEAGTGTGKTLAYLVPTLAYALQREGRVVVSTYTITLQEQLLRKDFALAAETLGIPIRAVALRGRAHYLCTQKLRRALEEAKEWADPRERQELLRIAQWARKTLTGCRDELKPAPQPSVWSRVASDPYRCNPNRCRPSNCFYQALRVRAAEADLLVVNHALFFSLLAPSIPELAWLGEMEGGVFRKEDVLVFDEAHTLETVAARQLGLEISWEPLESLLRALASKGRKGLLPRLGLAGLEEVVSRLDRELRNLFLSLCAEAEPHGYPTRVRVPAKGWDTLLSGLRELAEALAAASQESKDPFLAEEGKVHADLLGRQALALELWLSQGLAGHVYWVEGIFPSTTLCAIPVWVRSYLQKLLFRERSRVVFTSATLAVGGSFQTIQNRLGAGEARTLQLPSPFDYARQMRVYLVRDLPEPQPREDVAYLEGIARWTFFFCKQTQGGVLVLFTSYRTLEQVALYLRPRLAELGACLLVQSPGQPPHRLQEEFFHTPRPVLFGAQSFWQGVDFGGGSLKALILTRLPFPTPEEPLAQARMEELASSGQDPFREYTLPEALLRFRQGIGRLIRSTTDRGILAILDVRVLTRFYGRLFLESLPDCPKEVLEDERQNLF
jgi:ATP-dependent DNA helicase DinG